MSFKEELAGFTPRQDTALAIGVFDGVHLGHKALLAELKDQAVLYGLVAGVVTFRQHPEAVLPGRRPLPYLTSLSEKSRLLREEGVALIVTLSFTLELAKFGAADFIGLLKKHLRMSRLVIGQDFALGRNREGDAAALVKLGGGAGFHVTVVPPVKINREVVSSTAIRIALGEGRMEKIRRMMGRHFRLEERVVTGSGRGTELGFPTANLDTDPGQAIPADGVYAAWAYTGESRHRALCSIGVRPTFGAGERVVEVYLLDFQGDLYGTRLKVDIIQRLRPQLRFDSVVALKEGIESDIKSAEAVFNAPDGK